MAKHLWNIVSNKDSSWVKWVNLHILKARSVWSVDANVSSSWGWKQIMYLRDRIERFIAVKIGNGVRCNVWFDKWCPEGPLIKIINQRTIELAGLSINSSVADMILNDNWLWPQDWSNRFDVIGNLTIPRLVNDVEDRTVGVNKQGNMVKFSVREV